MSVSIESYSLFGGVVRNINADLGINSTSTVVTATIVRDGSTVSITNRRPVDISIGAFSFRGVVQSWSETKVSMDGTGVYQVRITDTKPVLNAAQVIIGSSFDDNQASAYDYGDNVISISPQNSSQISDGIPFSRIQNVVESATLKYGNQNYTVNFNFTLPGRGSSVTYTIKGRTMSLLELISQIANDHGLNWYVTTSSNNVISINMFGRTNLTDVTVNQLAALHANAIIKRSEGQANRDSIQKVVLIGGYRTYLNKVSGSVWQQFWGFDDNGNRRSRPLYDTDIMEQVINNDFTSDDYTENDVQKIIAYANEFWGRKFIARITPTTTIDSEGNSWVTPTSAGWNESNTIPAGLDYDGQFKFQTDDGRWITFITLPLPGSRLSTSSNATVSYQWDDSLFSNPNTHININNVVAMRASLEINGGYFILTTSTPLRVKKIEESSDDSADNITKIRLSNLQYAYLALLDQRETYGPWSNRDNSIGRTDVIVDRSLTPWNFGYRGITNTDGVNLMNGVALGHIKTVADLATDAKTMELEVAGVPAINIGGQLQTTGTITSMQVTFSVNGVRTIYKSSQYINELSKYQRQQQELIDRLRAEADAQNEEWTLNDWARSLKQEIPEPAVDVPDEGMGRQTRQLLGRINERSSNTEPKYNITPMAWVSDVFGELTLQRDPKVFGEYLNVVNMGEPQTAPGRLSVGTDVQVHEFAVTDGGIVSYYIDMAAPPPPNFVATIDYSVSNSQPVYKVTPVYNAVQTINLLQSELNALNAVTNIGEPANYPGYLSVGAEVMIQWNENSDGSYTPYIEQQLNLFKPLD